MSADIDTRKLSRCSATALRRLAAFMGIGKAPICVCASCSKRLVDRLRREMATPPPAGAKEGR